MNKLLIYLYEIGRHSVEISLVMRLLLLLFVLVCSSQQLDKGRRLYTCLLKEADEPSVCNLAFMTANDEHITIADNGCFVERAKNNQLKNYCPLQCRNAENVVVTKQTSEGINDRCVIGDTVGVQRRRNDWFFWRTVECAVLEAQFEIHCSEEQQEPFDVNLDFEGSGL
ncbi:unnamed protein product [Bursaphelenchus okinawaensis]|uniref:DUF7808 domain-containing protein n=1 Tax=Bursaphelenchus okinawaensis TaxID=465554 RepID=A0A811KUF3_9BILA|nr:unnamed protein product [Bursaphelenchus okinawaensis]CAG9112389.1 unnamed protein product [Bursaphelenchus okinawaensis]